MAPVLGQWTKHASAKVGSIETKSARLPLSLRQENFGLIQVTNMCRAQFPKI